ncbi:hypothetical protein [Streptomyces sp. NPDC005423]|uniref:hypothetical protein n=1 Tax=Streptomyces sp. NPDC005423 TaxID=3155343 RepID=UPI0033A3AAC0
MSNQPYEGYDEGHDPYAPHPPHPPHQPPQAWPGQQQSYDDPQAAQQYTQQWQGQTWETQIQPTTAPVPDPAYPSPQNQQQQQQQQSYGVTGHPLPPEAPGQQGQYGQHAQQGQYGQQGQQQAQGWNYQQPQSYAQPQQPYYPQAPAPEAPAPAAPAPAPGAEEGAGYGPATVVGNARVTDAQRARLEGRSPVIEPGMQPAALTAVLGLLLSVTAAVGSYALLVPLVVLQAVTAAGWFRLNGMWPARQGIALAFAGAVVADAALLAAGREHGPAAILGTLGVWVLLALVMQLRSHADPDERMYGLTATVTSAALSIIAAGHLAADPDAVTVGAAAVAVAVLARALPLPTPASVIVSLLAAAGAGIAVGGVTHFGTKGAVLGAGAAVCALIGHRVASYDYPSRFVHFTAGVALPLAASAPAVYVLGRALG